MLPPESCGPVNIGIILGILLMIIAHCSFPKFLMGCLHVLLLVNHGASPGAMHALACVHAQCLQTLSRPSPCVATCHGLSSGPAKHLVPTASGLVMKSVIGWPAAA